jgi:hypothetical protein
MWHAYLIRDRDGRCWRKDSAVVEANCQELNCRLTGEKLRKMHRIVVRASREHELEPRDCQAVERSVTCCSALCCSSSTCKRCSKMWSSWQPARSKAIRIRANVQQRVPQVQVSTRDIAIQRLWLSCKHAADSDVSTPGTSATLLKLHLAEDTAQHSYIRV